MTTVMARDGSRLLTGSAGAAQRLADALRTQRGAYPFIRDYGAEIADLVDRPLSAETEAAIYAVVAEAVRHPRNDLADVRLRGVRVQADPVRPRAAVVEVDAWWLPAPAGAATPITARAALDPAAGHEPAEPTNYVPHSFILLGAPRKNDADLLLLERWRVDQPSWSLWVQAQIGALSPGRAGGITWDGERLVIGFGDRWFTMPVAGGALTGRVTPHGAAPGAVKALAWVRGALYGIVAGQWSAIDPTTFTVRFIRRIDPNVVGMAFDGRTLWGVNNVHDQLLRVDPATGATTVVGVMSARFSRGMGWDPSTETLIVQDQQLGSMRVDPATGATEQLAGGGNTVSNIDLGLTAVPTHLLPA